jgi:hypothetical protein
MGAIWSPDAAVAPIGNDEDAAEMDLKQMLAWQ